MNLQTLVTKFDTGNLKADGTFTGYASVFGNVDSYRDIVAPGAFKDSLASRPAASVKLLWQHDPSQPIGTWTKMAEDRKGLAAEGKLLLNTPMGQVAYECLKEGAVDGLSIGFRTKADEIDRTTGIRTLKAVDLLEVSVVTFPANTEATVTGIKSLREMTIREIEEALERGTLPGLPSRDAKALLSGGYKALRGLRDAAEGNETVQPDHSVTAAALAYMAERLRS